MFYTFYHFLSKSGKKCQKHAKNDQKSAILGGK